MTLRLCAFGLAIGLAISGCAPTAPDYQSLLTTSSPSPSVDPQSDPAKVPISQYLESVGVTGDPVAPDKVTDLKISIPTPPGWAPYQGTNLSPGTRMIAKGDTYPTATLMVFELKGNFDVGTALQHANADALASKDFRQLNASKDNFRGFPSSMIEGSYDLNGTRMHSYNRIVIATGAPPANQRYLVQFTVTGYANQAAAQGPDIEAVIKGFTLTVPK